MKNMHFVLLLAYKRLISIKWRKLGWMTRRAITYKQRLEKRLCPNNCVICRIKK